MRVLVTGGCGFVGSHAVAHLLDTTDWDIVVVDGLTYAGDTGRITEHHGYDPARVKVVWHDLRAPLPPSLIERIGPVDAVWSIAANSHVDRSLDDPVPFVHSNVAIATSMLEYARQVKPRVFVHCSTDEVFGPAPDGYHHHEWDTVLPSNPYAASKAAQDACAVAWWRSYGVPVVKTNTMNMFGERQNPEKFIPLTIARLAEGAPVPVHGRKVGDVWRAGSRKYLHARNLADAYRWITERAMERGVSAYPVSDRPDAWNVCGVEMTNDGMGWTSTRPDRATTAATAWTVRRSRPRDGSHQWRCGRHWSGPSGGRSTTGTGWRHEGPGHRRSRVHRVPCRRRAPTSGPHPDRPGPVNRW